jgi:hypothetical protein
MVNTGKAAICFSEEEKSISVYDRVSRRELVITKWDKIGRGNTSVSSQDGDTTTQAYISFLFEDEWYSVTVDDINGISMNKITTDEILDKGPLIWLKDGENNNW